MAEHIEDLAKEKDKRRKSFDKKKGKDKDKRRFQDDDNFQTNEAVDLEELKRRIGW